MRYVTYTIKLEITRRLWDGVYDSVSQHVWADTHSSLGMPFYPNFIREALYDELDES